jgi:O-antigen/teichoic acid export membrane protein
MASIFQQAWTPLAIERIADEAGRNEFYRRALNYYAGTMTVLALFLAAYSSELMLLLAPAEYQAAYVVIPWLIGARILSGSGSITNLGMLISKRTIGNSIAAWIGAFANIAIAVVLIPLIGIWGVAIGAFVAALIFTSLLCFFTIRVTDVEFDLGKVFSILLCYVLSCTAFVVVTELVTNSPQSLGIRTALLAIAVAAVLSLTIDGPALRAIRSTINLKRS